MGLKIFSGLLTLSYLIHFRIDILAAEVLKSSTNNTPPLQISTHDLILKVGSSDSVVVFLTNTFDVVFENVTNASLEFKFDNSDVIENISSKSLVVNRSLIFENTSIPITAIHAGRVIITSEIKSDPVVNITLTDVYLRVTTYKSSLLLTIGDIVGWIYFFSWSISFYPQIYQNWKRKSVRGLSLDFVFLNVTGFLVYGIFNIGLFWIPEIQSEYFIKYPTGVIPVQLNDVIFTLHAIFASGITLIQCIIYEKGSQTVSNPGRMLLMFIYIFLSLLLIIALTNSEISWLTFLTVFSYVKLFITLVKYLPQAYMNWSRKSTSGWSIGNVLLDLTGGVFSLLQMIIFGYNYNDWWSLLTDFTKFGLGVFSICFDILFIMQHYCLYKNHDAYEPIEGSNAPVDPYEDMVTSNHIQHDELERFSHNSASSSISSPSTP